MAAQNRRRNDTSKHAVGVWEEFSFLDKGNFGTREGNLLCFGSWAGFDPLCVPFRERQSNHLEKFLKYPKNGNTFYFRPNHLRRPGKSRNDEHTPPVRTNNRIRYPRWEASSDGKKFVREVGKLELYLWKKIWLNRFFRELRGRGAGSNSPLFLLPNHYWTGPNKGNPTV